MKIFNKNKFFGTYPSCDFLNRALQILLENPDTNREAINEILYALGKASGYIYEDVAIKLYESGWKSLIENERKFKKLMKNIIPESEETNT